MRRVITFICVFFVLVFVLCVPAFADDGSHFTLGPCYIFDNTSQTWIEKPGTWAPYNNKYLLRVLYNDSSATQRYYGLRFSLIPNGYVMVDDGYFYNISFTFTDNVTESAYLESVKDSFKLTFFLSDGTSIDANPYTNTLVNDGSGNYNWFVGYSLYIGDGVPVRITGISFETLYPSPSFGAGAYTVEVSSSISTEPTPELKRHLEVLEKLQEIYSGLSEEIEKQTEELTNGWENTGDEPADVGGASDSLADAENAALSGKSDSEIISEVASALASSGLPPQDLSSPISSIFDRLLDAFGTGYQSLLILALTLGLAAFLVGRSWAKGG